MKKVFVSIPLKGRSKDDIQKSLDRIQDAVKGLFDKEVEILYQDLEDLPDFAKGDEGFEENLDFLAKDIDLMKDADYFATISNNWDFRHCRLEEDIFRAYKAKNWSEERDSIMEFSLNIIAPDLIKKEKEEAEKLFGMVFERDKDYIEAEEERINKD